MAEDGEKITLEKLSDSNWSIWRKRMKAFLRAKELWDIVEGNETPPASGSDRATTDWIKKRNKAVNFLYSSVQSEVFYIIEDVSEDDPAAIWRALEGHFEQRTTSRKLHTLKQLMELKMDENGSVQNHLRKHKEIIAELRKLELHLPEELVVCILLLSLPASYNTLVTALEAQAEVPTLEFVSTALLNEERKRESSCDTGICSSLLSRQEVRRGRFTKQKAKKPASDSKCFVCDKMGHFARNCPLKKNESKNKRAHMARYSNEGSTADVATKSEYLYEEAFAVFKGGNKQEAGVWVIDSGASSHMVWDECILRDYREFDVPENVYLGDSRVLRALGTGSVNMSFPLPGGEVFTTSLKNVLYVPEMAINLFSVFAVIKEGNYVLFDDDNVRIFSNAKALRAIGERKNKLYYLRCKELAKANSNEANMASVGKKENLKLWHRRLGHAGNTRIQGAIKNNAIQGTKIGIRELQYEGDLCEPCELAKAKRIPFPNQSMPWTTKRLQLVHSDICGPLTPRSLGGNSYFITFTDDFSRVSRVYFLKQKSQALDALKDFVASAENETEEKIKILRTDNGGEYISNAMQNFLKSRGIQHQRTVPDSPQQNGVSERLNRTLLEMARAMMADSELPKCLWAEAISAACYVKNRLPTSCLKDNQTPYECWYGRAPNVEHLRIFGCTAYVHVNDQARQKLDMKSEKMIFVGYQFGTKGYRVYDPKKQKIFVRRNVIFDERNPVNTVEFDLTESSSCTKDEESASYQDSSELVKVKGKLMPARQPSERVNKGRFTSPKYEEEFGLQATESDRLLSEHFALIGSHWIQEPKTWADAMASEHSDKWKEAAEAEYASLLEMQTWDLVDLPADRKPIGSKWVFRVKHKSDGTVDRFKARFVAKGYAQAYGIDYKDTFSPVVKFTSIRAILAFAVQEGLIVHQMDVVTAFLNGILEEEIYIKQPEGFVASGSETKVLKLRRSIYGLKQSPRCWNKVFSDYLLSIGLTQSEADPCIYVKLEPLVILAVYVDDLIVMTRSEDQMIRIKEDLKRGFKMKDMGELHYCLGISIEKDHRRGGVYLHQKQYIKNMLQKFGLQDAKEVSIPFDHNQRLVKDDGISKSVDKAEYQSLVGSLLYAAVATRPDISYSVGVVARYCANPNQSHLTAAKRILRYLKGTMSYGLVFTNRQGARESIGNQSLPIGYCDADWASDSDDRKSVSGNLFVYSGAAISWLSKKQHIVALSTTEAEYVSLSIATQEAVWLRRLFRDIGANVSRPMCLNEDNLGALNLAKNSSFHARTKHIDIRFHFIRSMVDNKEIKINYCSTKEMIADVLTKGLDRTSFQKFRQAMGIKIPHLNS